MYIQEKNVVRDGILVTKININCFAIDEKQFIKDKFKRQYNADINITYPYVASIQDHTGVLCAAGFRFAKNEKLFLEQYFDKPVEDIIGVERFKIVEIGNLAVDDFTKLFKFLAEVSEYLIDSNIETVCITATEKLARILQRRDIQGYILTEANPSDLQESNENWGEYYSTNPKVYTFNLKENITKLQELSYVFKRGYKNVHYYK